MLRGGLNVGWVWKGASFLKVFYVLDLDFGFCIFLFVFLK
jgi:hypothetical protein